MFEGIRAGLARDARTAVVAVVAASVVSGPAAVAAVYVANADKVDNKHAVSAGATVSARKGKLVATNATTGRLPDNNIAKAPDANLLDGKDSAAFLARTGKAADTDLLDGFDSSYFLPRGEMAVDSDMLDGKDSADFLSSTGKAADADLLDGKDSADFLSSTGKAADADLLDGIDSSQLPTRAELGDAGFVNQAGNPVHWTKLKNVPVELADGDDAGQGIYHGVQYSGSIAASATQTFFTHSWPKNTTMIWQAVPTTPGGRVSTSVSVEDAGSTFTYWITIKNELASPVNYDARYTVIPRY